MAEDAPNFNPQADTARPLGRTELDYLDLASELEIEKPAFRQADQPERFHAWADRVDQLVVHAWRGQTDRFNELKIETNAYAGHRRDRPSTELDEPRLSPQRLEADTFPERGDSLASPDHDAPTSRESPAPSVQELERQLRDAFDEEGIAYEELVYFGSESPSDENKLDAARERLSRAEEALARADAAYDPYRPTEQSGADARGSSNPALVKEPDRANAPEQATQQNATIEGPEPARSSLADPLAADAVSPAHPHDREPRTIISPAEHIEQLQAELRNSALIPPEEREQIQEELTRALAETSEPSVLNSKALAAKRDPNFVETRSLPEIERDDILEAAHRFEAAGRTEVAANLRKDAAAIDLTRTDENTPNERRPDPSAVPSTEPPPPSARENGSPRDQAFKSPITEPTERESGAAISTPTPDSPRPSQRDRLSAAQAELALFDKSSPPAAPLPSAAAPQPRQSETPAAPRAERQASPPDVVQSQPAESPGAGRRESPQPRAAAPESGRSPLSGASKPAGSDLGDKDASQTQPAPKQGEAFDPKDPAKQQKPAPHITLSGPGGALYDIFSAMRRDRTDAAAQQESRPTQTAQAAPARSQEDYSNRFAKFEQKNMQPRRDEEALSGAEDSAQAALAALNSLNSQRGASILNRIRAAAEANPNGMPGVISEMKAGGAYEGLRKEFSSALDTDRGFADSYKKAASALNLYGDKRAEISPILATLPNPQTAAKFTDFDDEIADAASKLPGLKQGTSAIDELTEKAREILHKAFERVSAALKSAASANAEASPSPSPSPGP